MANKILADLILKIQSDASELKKGVSETNQSLGGFKKGLGEISGLVKGAFAAGAIIAAAKAVGEFALQIGKARDEAQSLTNLTGDALDTVTSKALALSSTFGADFNEVLKTANTLSNEFGITVEDALDKLQKGYVAGANANGDFLEGVAEYSSQLNSIVKDTDEFIALQVQGVKEGIFSDKALDAVKEAGIRIRELTPATRDAIRGLGLPVEELERGLREGSISISDVIRQVSQRIGELPQNSKEVGTALADIFGGAGEDAGLNFIKGLSVANQGLDDLVENATDAQKAQNRIATATADLNETFVDLFGSTNQGWLELKAVVLEFAVDALQAIKKFAIDTANYFITLYNESLAFRIGIQAIGIVFKNTFDIIRLIFNRFVTTLKNTGRLIKAVLTGNFRDIPGIIRESFTDTVNDFKDLGKDVFENYKEGFDNAINAEKLDLISDKDVDDSKSKAKTGGKEVGIAAKDAIVATFDAYKKGDISRIVAIEILEGQKEALLGQRRFAQESVDNIKRIIETAQSIIENAEIAGDQESILEYTQVIEDWSDELIAAENAVATLNSKVKQVDTELSKFTSDLLTSSKGAQTFAKNTEDVKNSIEDLLFIIENFNRTPVTFAFEDETYRQRLSRLAEEIREEAAKYGIEIPTTVDTEEYENRLQNAEKQLQEYVQRQQELLDTAFQVSAILQFGNAIDETFLRITDALTGAEDAWDGFRDFLENWAKQVVSQIISVITQAVILAGILSIITGGATAGGISFANAFKGFLGGFFGFSQGGQIDRKASGGLFGDSSLAVVGETGAELISAPVGSQVFNPFQTQRMLAGSGAGGQVVFRIERDALVGVLNKDRKIKNNF